MIRLSFFILLVYGISGCTFHSSQLNLVSSLFASPPAPDAGWIGRYGDYVEQVTPVASPPFIVFANSSGSAVGFDGWRIRSVVGFGLSRPIIIDYDRNDPVFDNGRGHVCSEWSYRPGIDGGVWVQVCESDVQYENSVALDDQGRIIYIEQVVEYSGARLIMEKLEAE